ncbi:MAG TPA: methylmalonyl Co-A mutase-associated GTPase MeaB [Candidatus Limnocylindrales bacterium]|nr:methylmalonyl Co-A mutase-associated GTPase MeaB [Candidatus Limnocylindrales bacterium]
MSTRNRDPHALAEATLAGDRVALARLITLVENRAAHTAEVMSRIYKHCGHAFTIGLTGPPGAGKSTMTSAIIGHCRERGLTVGVVAIDPSSPFSGGSVLGDRIRMQRHFLDEGVFIRSLSTRGSHGGLTRSGRDVARLMDASGKDVVIIETVGVGQTELDIMEVADTVVVILVPEAGDTVQVMKAGLLEIADVFVVNKADREGATRMRTELEMMLALKSADDSNAWKVPVLLTKASAGEGTEAVLDAAMTHREFRKEHPQRDVVARRLRAEVFEICEEEVMRRLRSGAANEAVQTTLARVSAGEQDPYHAALEILGDRERLAQMLAGKNGVGS